MKILFEEQFSFNSDIYWSHESTVFLHDEKIELETNSLSKEICDVQFLYWISDEQKNSANESSKWLNYESADSSHTELLLTL